jgi:hypothetical protein
MLFSGIANGNGLSGSSVEVDSILLIKNEQERALEKFGSHLTLKHNCKSKTLPAVLGVT